MNIPVPEGKINVFKITGGGKKQFDGLESPRLLCDETEIPLDDIHRVEIFLKNDDIAVKIERFAHEEGIYGKMADDFSRVMTIRPRTIQIDGYTPIGTLREKIREQSEIGG